MVDVSRWLAEQGLGHHAEVFAKHGVGSDVLHDLTDADLKELGLNLGDRKRLLKAIGALSAGFARDRAEAAEPSATPAVPREAERRQLTVMFVDLVGSTHLSAQLDPEDMSALIRAYQNAVVGEVARFEGHVAKYMGDGVLAYFGWPQAHEDDAERAVRAGLELAKAVGEQTASDGTKLAARIGIATGQVVVGELIGEGAAKEEAVVGETPNLAARLQASAAPGKVMIAANTRRLVGRVFELDDLGAQQLKGFAEPVLGWRVIGERRTEGRFEARQTAGLTPLVGREEEMALLLRRWQQAKDGEGQVVLLSGEPGIGKSRLVHELRRQLEGEPHTRILYQCSPHHMTSPLHPLVVQLERAAGFARDDPPEARIEKLEALLARGTDRLDQAVPLVAALLGLSTAGRWPALGLSPQRQKQRTLEALVEQLEGLSSTAPVLLAYEDAHWLDPTTQELLGLIIERVQRLPALLLITMRPEFSPPWPAQSHVSALALTRLGRREGAALVERVVGAKALPDEVSGQIVAKTDGVPLFVEELTRTVLESGLLCDAGDRYELSGPLPPLAIPATLQDSLVARLDRLAPARQVAQIGASIGREFPQRLLASVARLPEPELGAALEQLVDAGLIFSSGEPPELIYSFKHALVQEAAYQTLLRGRRRELHAKIAHAMERDFPETVEARPELLGYHLSLAGLPAKAVEYWQRAAQLAAMRSAMVEALGHLSQALEQLKVLPESSDRIAKELELTTTLGGVLTAVRGYSAPETGETYSHARALSRRAEMTGERLFPVLYGQWGYRFVRGEFLEAQSIAEQMLSLAGQRNDEIPPLVAHRVLGVTTFFLGRLTIARMHLERVLSEYRERHRSSIVLYTVDQRVAALAYLSLTLFQLGYPDQAIVRIEEALDEARKLGHPPSLAYALQHACVLHQDREDANSVMRHANALISLAAEQAFPYWSIAGQTSRGVALLGLGQAEEGIAALEKGVGAMQLIGAEIGMPGWMAFLGMAYGQIGQSDKGLELVDRALALAAAREERWNYAELHRFEGELLAAALRPDRPAEACFCSAIAVARDQAARLWELRAAISLARLWCDQGRRAEAHDLLAPVYGWFTEGFDTADLKDAKALLDELA